MTPSADPRFPDGVHNGCSRCWRDFPSLREFDRHLPACRTQPAKGDVNGRPLQTTPLVPVLADGKPAANRRSKLPKADAQNGMNAGLVRTCARAPSPDMSGA